MPYLHRPDELDRLLPGEPAYRAAQLHRWLYRTPVLEPAEMTSLPGPVREALAGRLWPFAVEVEQTADAGATRKWLFRCPDGASIEAVLMRYPRRVTLCISSQAGCAMACTFCATGQFGFDRHLEPGEIVAQVAYAAAVLRRNGDTRPTNIVFMGMGEPLANYARVREAIRRLVEDMGISARAITVSTVGVVPGMRRLAGEGWPLNLAVSLHAADDELRSSLVPLNSRYPLAEVVAAARFYHEQTGRRVSIEWTLIDRTNDTPDQARALARIAAGLRAHVNVIPLNPTPLSPDRPSGPSRVDRFVAVLRREGANVTLRETRGRSIDAACGQLRVHHDQPIRLASG